MKRLLRRMATYLLRRNAVRKAIAEGGDFRVYTNRPTPQVMAGLFLIFFSYVIGWPAIIALGWIANQVKEPLVIVVGGPLMYGLSNLVFNIGAFIAGRKYVTALMKWLVKVTFEKILGPENLVPGGNEERKY